MTYLKKFLFLGKYIITYIMLEAISKNQKNFLLQQKKFRSYTGILEKSVTILNEKSILSISGLRYTWITELASEIVQKTWMQENFFYFNPYIDTYGRIKSEKDLILLMDYKIRTWDDIKIIILEDCNIIDGIKNFIINLYKSKNFKIVILWNNIKIDWVEEVQLFSLSHKDSINSSKKQYKYGWLPHVKVVPDASYKKILLNAFLSNIIEKEIVIPYNIKSTENFKKALSFLAYENKSFSLREIHRWLEEHGVYISLITLIEYINIATTTKIIYRLEVYDFKKNTSIHTNVLYHFWDIWIRNTLSNYDTIMYDNVISNELLLHWYELYTWKNGAFRFDIYAKKWNISFWIACTDSDDKIEVRKLARKLAKVPWLDKKYVIVQNKEKLAMRKFFENGVQICEVSEFIENL